MKILRTAIIVFFIFFAFGCNNSQNKKDVKDLSDVIKTTSDNSIADNQNKTTDNELQVVEIELQAIENIVKEILITSKRYKQITKGLNKQIIKNGGLSFEIIMEKSPDQSMSDEYRYSKTYDFTLYEMYPDRRLGTARFSFNPHNKQLYEYDAVNDMLIPIEFDKNLLIKYEAFRK
jgi:hypothetical protein